jgi:allantoinase
MSIPQHDDALDGAGPFDNADLGVIGMVQNRHGRWERREILVTDGRIIAISAPGLAHPKRQIDAGASYLLPGMVDAHVHCLSAEGEGVVAATAAAAAGGVTTILEMPFDFSGPIANAERLARKQEFVARQAHIDVALLGTALPDGGWRQIDELREGGVVGLKASLFDTDPFRFPRTPDPQLLNTFTAAAANGLPVCVHAENNEIIKELLGQMDPSEDPLAHMRSRPPVSETLGVLTALEIATYTDVQLHLCHTSLPRSVDLVRRYAALDGMDVTLETCPHYMLLTEDDMAAQGTRLKINPPLRTAAAKEGLWDRLAVGDIDVISSDHAPWALELKTKPNVFANHSGAPGVQTIYPLVLAEAHARGADMFTAAIKAMTIGPAIRYGLDGRKGDLAVGMDADIVVFDPGLNWTVENDAMLSNAGWTPYDQQKIQGGITMTLNRGRVVWDGELRAAPGDGTIVGASRAA